MTFPQLNLSKGTPNRFPHAPVDPLKWPAGCCPHRDGWVRWYKGRTVFVCGKRTPLGDVEDAWIAKKGVIDASERGEVIIAQAIRTYRQVASDFLAAMEHRCDTGKPRPLSRRMLHNYGVEVNALGIFVFDGIKVADLEIAAANRPEVLSAYARKYGARKASGFDSIVTRVGALFNWAVEMEYIDRFRPGPGFQRPPKREVRDQRIELEKSFNAKEVAKLFVKANITQKCWIGLGVSAGFTNADVATVSRSVVDLKSGVIDFRRRKTGKIRRVIPLPADILAAMKEYARPDPIDDAHADLFFLTNKGTPYSTTRSNGPSCTLSRLFRKLMEAAKVKLVKGRSFTGLRTTLYNLTPKGGEYDLERKIIMGRAQGSVDLDSYLEDVGMDRLKHLVNHVWHQVSVEIQHFTK